MASQRERTGMETFVSLLKFWAAMIYLPICLFSAFFHTISSEDGDGEIALIFWALFVAPFIIRQFTLQKRRRALNSVVEAVSGEEFMPQKGNVIISGNRTYLGVDAIRGTLLYVSMRRKGEYDVMGMDMSSWTRVAYKGDVITLKPKTRNSPASASMHRAVRNILPRCMTSSVRWSTGSMPTCSSLRRPMSVPVPPAKRPV